MNLINKFDVNDESNTIDENINKEKTEKILSISEMIRKIEKKEKIIINLFNQKKDLPTKLQNKIELLKKDSFNEKRKIEKQINEINLIIKNLSDNIEKLLKDKRKNLLKLK